jgi:hypothetical protein
MIAPFALILLALLFSSVLGSTEPAPPSYLVSSPSFIGVMDAHAPWRMAETSYENRLPVSCANLASNSDEGEGANPYGNSDAEPLTGTQKAVRRDVAHTRSTIETLGTSTDQVLEPSSQFSFPIGMSHHAGAPCLVRLCRFLI